jgi:aspartate/tyrosine/aromatic aminotransferase
MLGQKTREYQGGGYKDRFLNLTVRCYVNQEDATLALDQLLEDIETVIEDNSRLEYLDKRGVPQYTQQISIISIDTDEGVLEPLGVGELLIQVQY